MSKFSCLLIGSPGVGKTTAASTAPSPVLFIDVDNKLHKMQNVQDKLKRGDVIQWAVDEPLMEISLTRLASAPIKPGATIATPRPKGYSKIAEMIDKLVENDCMIEHEGKKVRVATVVLDSYTSLNEHLKRLLTSVNQTTTMTLSLHGTALTNFEILNNTLLRLNANVIFICHEKPSKDELTGTITYSPQIEGQMSHKIGKDFEEVYYIEKTVQGGKAKYEMLTIGSSMKPCRTSRELPAKVEPNFAKIYGA